MEFQPEPSTLTRRKRRTMARKPLTPPTRRHLHHWAEVCRYMDGRPHRCISAPFPDDPPISYPLLRNMAQFKLVRHRNSDCTWQLSPNWQKILARLAKGMAHWEEESQKAEKITGTPFVVDYGVDTLYINILAEELPTRLLAACTDLKAHAQVTYKPYSTPWLFGGIPLLMYPNGKAASETGGVSWGFILRNELVEIRIRKKPMSGIVAAVHFLAKCLWLNGPKPSLNLMVNTFRMLWADRDAFKQVRYQLSQIHLCADVAHFPLDTDYLRRLVSHSFKRVIHIPSQADLDLDDSAFDADTTTSEDEDMLFYGMEPDDYDTDEFDPAIDLDPDEADADAFGDEDDEDVLEGDPDEDEPAEEWHQEGATLFWRGKAVQGFGFSPSGALSAAWYDKIQEERKSGKKWMRVIHEAGGWQLGMVLTRVELRYKRPILNEIEVAFGQEKGQHWFDHPWVALQHLGDLWGFGVGLPPEHDHAPDVTHRGWMRIAIPDPNDATRSRWRTDPLWEVVQRVPFNEGTPKPLKRAKQAKPDLDKIDAELRGLLVTRAMLAESYLEAPASLSRELEAFDERMREWEQEKGLDFAEQVRERARMAGKAVPYKAPFQLPMKPRGRRKKIL